MPLVDVRETVAVMLARGISVWWRCDAGYPDQHGGDADLQAMVAAGKGGVVLALRRPPCPEPGCPGRVTFYGKDGMWHKRLDLLTVGDPGYREYTDQRAAEFKALGWVWDTGQYVKRK